MKYALVFLVGALTTVFLGEKLIPNSLGLNTSYGCLAIKSNPSLVFLPKTDVYDHDTGEAIPLYLNDSNIFSFSLAYEILVGDVTKLSQKECNQIIEKAYLK